MSSIPLIIDSEAILKISALATHAAKNVISVTALNDIIAGRRPPPGDIPANSIYLNSGFKVVFTLEDHPQKDYLPLRMRHLSVSTDNPGQLPSHKAMADLLRRFGFSCRFTNYRVWVELLQNGFVALNIIEPAIIGGSN